MLKVDCHRIAIGRIANRPRAFLFRFASSDGGFDNLGRTLVGVGEQIPVDAEGDCRRAVAKPAADGEHVHPRCDELGSRE